MLQNPSTSRNLRPRLIQGLYPTTSPKPTLSPTLPTHPPSNFFPIVILLIVKRNTKSEMRALAKFGSDTDLAVKALDDVFGDHEAQPYSLCVHATSVGYLAEEFEQLSTIFLGDADAGVDHRDDDFVLVGHWAENVIHFVVVLLLLVESLAVFVGGVN